MAPARLEARVTEARKIVTDSCGTDGIWASPDWGVTDVGYRYQAFTRDLGIGGAAGLRAIGRTDLLYRHLEKIRRMEEAHSGTVPTYFKDPGYMWAAQKVLKVIANPDEFRANVEKVMNVLSRRHTAHEHTSNTTDEELWYLKALHEFSLGETNYQFIAATTRLRVMDTVKGRVEDNLYRGGDWRDNVGFPDDVALLSNNVLLFGILDRTFDQASAKLKYEIRDRFWRADGFYSDQPGNDSFDTFGQALAVLEKVADPTHRSGIYHKLWSMATPWGLRANDLSIADCPPELRAANERVNQYGQVWDHATGYGILALNKMGYTAAARELFDRWTRAEGFPEFRDWVTGEPGGGRRQMWSAALYLKVARVLEII